MNIQLSGAGAQLLEKQHYNDAGHDISSMATITIKPGERVLVPTGIYVDSMPDNMSIEILPRSGMPYKTGIIIPNSPGLIDAGYHDEIKVCLFNLSHHDYEVRKGDRIAQLVFREVLQPSITISTKKTHIANERSGGFGSTGR